MFFIFNKIPNGFLSIAGCFSLRKFFWLPLRGIFKRDIREQRCLPPWLLNSHISIHTVLSLKVLSALFFKSHLHKRPKMTSPQVSLSVEDFIRRNSNPWDVWIGCSLYGLSSRRAVWQSWMRRSARSKRRCWREWLNTDRDTYRTVLCNTHCIYFGGANLVSPHFNIFYLSIVIVIQFTFMRTT